MFSLSMVEVLGMVNSFIMRTGVSISVRKKGEEAYKKMGKVEKIHIVETGFILEFEDGAMIKVRTKESKPKDPDISGKAPKHGMIDNVKV